MSNIVFPPLHPTLPVPFPPAFYLPYIKYQPIHSVVTIGNYMHIEL